MAPEGQHQFIGQYAEAIVFHADQAHTTGQQTHSDLGGAGVKRVVYQFAHDGGGPFYDFARSDLANQLVGQFTDGAAGGKSG